MATYMKETYGRTLVPAIGLAIVLLFLKSTYHIDSFIELLSAGAVGGLIYMILVYFTALSGDEKQWVGNQVVKRLQRA